MGRASIVLATWAALWVGTCHRAGGGCEAGQGEDLVVADFESGLPSGLRPTDATAEHGTTAGEAAAGKGFLRLKADAGKAKMIVRIPLPPGADVSACGALRGAVRLPRDDQTWPLRWYALDESGRPMFQRRFELKPDGQWARVEEPLAVWRWGNRDVGRWDRVKTLALAMEAPAAEIALDDLRLAPARGGASAYPTREWLLGVAFPEGRPKLVDEDGFLIATDAAEATEADLRKVLGQMQRARQWIARVFGDAVQPSPKDRPISLFIFRSQEEYEAFFKRLGEVWRAEIAAPRSGGYTVQDITGTTWSPQYGADRPVFLHEAIHTIAARLLDVRLEVEDRAWFHEGLANYVQLCVYPKSLDWRTYGRNFSQPVAADGSTFFKPLKLAMTRRGGTEQYAQLASLTAFLVEERPEWLPKIAKGLAAGEPVDKVLADCGTEFDKLQDEWLAWGRTQFTGDRPATRFPMPKEWAGE